MSGITSKPTILFVMVAGLLVTSLSVAAVNINIDGEPVGENIKPIPSSPLEKKMSSSPKKLTVYCIDVGQGDSTLIITPSGVTLLIDGGKNGKGNSVIVPLMGSLELETLNYTIATHYHADHIGGIDEVVNSIPLQDKAYDRGGSYSSNTYADYVDAVGEKRATISKGNVIDLGDGTTVTCIAENGNGVEGVSNENDLGVVIKLTYKNFDMYFGGDISGTDTSNYKDIESTVVEDFGDVEVYQVDHHGSKYSTNQHLVDTIKPNVATFSVGDNSYGHPAQEVIDRLANASCYMYFTEEGAGGTPKGGDGEIAHGNIKITTEGNSYTINGEKTYTCDEYHASKYHAPIYIDGNANFTAENGITSGNGTQTDPYIIENWEINVSSANGIDIRNTNAYFVIRNCVVHEGTGNGHRGVNFYNVTNGKIDNVTSYQNSGGIKLQESLNNKIINCNVYNNSWDGIYLYSSSNNNTITNCSIYNNWDGIELQWSTNNKITNNTFTNDGLVILGGDLCDYFQVIENNTINDKPLYYYKNQTNVIIDNTPIGELMLVNCTNFTMNNIELSSTDVGIYLAYSSNNTITNCKVYNNSEGIKLWRSSNNTIANCKVHNNSEGIELWCFSNDNTITNCDVYNGSWYGIYLYDSSNNKITNCSVYNNREGIESGYSSNNKIYYSNIYNNTKYGVRNPSAPSQYKANATHNWWGSASGPGGVGSGSGDKVSGNVLYAPWLIEPLDVTAPIVLSTQPIDGATDVPINTTIVITFSEPMNITTIPGNITITSGIQIKSYKWNSNNTTVTLTLASNLLFYTEYIITITTNVADDGTKDSSGAAHPPRNHLQNPCSFSFRTRTKDITPPEIANVAAKPPTQEVYGYVNISAKVSDNVMVNAVYVNIIYPNSNLVGNFSMSGFDLDANKNGTYYYNTSYSALGSYRYYIWANDTSGNGNASPAHHLTIRDTKEPMISNIQATPETQEVYSNVNITCTVTDNVKVSIVKAKISGSAGFAPVNISMIRVGTTNEYYYNTSYSCLGDYSYYIWANDTSGNGNASPAHHLTIRDTKEPTISNIQATPETQEVYSCVNITCNVSDNVKVSIVKVSISGPAGFAPVNISMIRVGTTNEYYYNTSYSCLGDYSYYIWANDTSGNQISSAGNTFTAHDTTKPVISDVQASPLVQTQKGYVNITCSATDNVGVALVNVNIRGAIGFTLLNATMTRIGNTNNYYFSIPYSIPGTYTFYILANDTSGNGNKSAQDHFNIRIKGIIPIDGKEIKVTGSGEGGVNIEPEKMPKPAPKNLQNITCVEVTTTGTLNYMNITIRYAEEDVAGVDESTLKIYYWDESENRWMLCSNTGVDVTNNIVWTNVTRLTIFAPMGEIIEKAPLPYWALYVGIAAIIIILAVAFVIIVKKRKKLKE